MSFSNTLHVQLTFKIDKKSQLQSVEHGRTESDGEEEEEDGEEEEEGGEEDGVQGL